MSPLSDGDREGQEKFNKLMGVKGETKVENKQDKTTQMWRNNANICRWNWKSITRLDCVGEMVELLGSAFKIFLVNRPYLPIAAGDLSEKSSWFLVLMLAACGLLIVGLNFGPFITSL